MRRRLATALVAGMLAGAAVGLGDALLAWGRMGQFVPGAGGKLHAGLLTLCLYALALGLGSLVLVALATGLAAATRLGRFARHLVSEHDRQRAADPQGALIGVSLVLAGVPAMGLALAGAYAMGMGVIATRHHKGLVVVSVIGLTLVAVAVGAVVTLLLARLIEMLIRRIRWRPLSHVSAPFWVLGGMLVLGAVVARLVFARALSLDQLNLRPFGAALALGAALPFGFIVARRILLRLDRARPLVRRNLPAALLALLIGVTLMLGAGEGPRKATAAYTGLGGPLMQGLRRVVDLDRDGFSPLMGGGDCNDLSASIHPGADEIPDDGIDQNCANGDLTFERKPADARFVELPPGVPRDASIVFITVDALRADHLGVYGYKRQTTPTIDAIAKEGTVFEHGFAHAPSTRYSVPAILTGRYPSQVAWDTSVWWPALKDENLTMAEVMKAAGLFTGAILNYHYFDRVRRMDQGFDEYDNDDARLHQGSDPAATEGSSSREQTDKAIAWVDKHQDQRFFLWVHYYDPHYKYQHHPGTTAWGNLPVDLYDEEIRFTDDQLGRLVKHLKDTGRYDKTVFVITGDHGEGFGEHGIQFHGYNLYAAQTRVPLIIRVPGVAPARVALPAGHIDLLPTLANLVGQPADAIWQGRSLLGEVVRAPGATPDGDRDIYQEVVYEGPTRRYGAVSQRWHLLYNQTPDNTWELYDLAADPAESRDVSGAGGEAVAQMKSRFLGWLDALALPPDAAAKLTAAMLHARPTPRTPLDLELGGTIKIIGVDLPGEVKAGQPAQITYYLEGLAPQPGDWRLFVHIEGPGGRIQDDHVPVDGAMPFARFKAGTLVADSRAPTVPPHFPPGVYTVYVGLWQPKKGNLAVTRGTPDAKGRLVVGSFRVAR